MSGKLVLPKTSVPLIPLILDDIQSNHIAVTNNNTSQLLPFFQVVSGLSISIINRQPLTLFVSAGKVLIKMDNDYLRGGYVLDIPSKTLILEEGLKSYLIGISIDLTEEDNFRNPLQGGNVMGSLGAKRLVYRTQLIVNNDSFTIGIVSIGEEIEVKHINSKGNITTHRNINTFPIPYLDSYKKDIGDYVARGFNITNTDDCYILSPGIAYISGTKIDIPRPTIIDRPLINKLFDIGISTDREVVIKSTSGEELGDYLETIFLTTEEEEHIYVDRNEDDVQTKVYIHEKEILSSNIRQPLLLKLYQVGNGIREYPVFMPSNSEIRNIESQLLDIERRTASIINRINLITNKGDKNVSKYIVISSFNSDNSDVNYPGYSAHTDSNGLNTITSNLRIDIPFLDARDNLYPYYLAGQLVTVYPIWYEVSNISTPIPSNYINVPVSPTHLIFIQELKYLLLIFNETSGVIITKDDNTNDNPLLGRSTDGRTYTGSLIALIGIRPNKLTVNNKIYTQGLNLTLGRGTISQPIELNRPLLCNKVYLAINSPSLLLITEDYLNKPDLTKIIAWGYSSQSSNYIELSRPIWVNNRVHVLLIPSSSVPISNTPITSTTQSMLSTSSTYMGESNWGLNTYYLPVRLNEIDYRQVNNEVPLTISNNNEFNELVFNLVGVKALNYTFQSGFQSGVSSSPLLNLHTYTQSVNIKLTLSRGDYLDVLGSYIDLGYKSKTLDWISINYSINKSYSGVEVLLDAEVQLSFSSNYGQAWTIIPKVESGIYRIENLSPTVPYEGVTETKTLLRNNLKFRIQSTALSKPITNLQAKLIHE